MRIAIFTDSYLPDINGVANSTRILRDELAKHGHDVLIVTTELPSGSDYVDDIPVLRLPGVEIKQMYGYRMSSVYSMRGMKEVKAFAPDIVHIQMEFGISAFGRIVAELLNIPSVYMYHTMWADYTHYLSRGIKGVDVIIKKIVEKLSRVYGKYCSELIVPSEKTAEVLRSYGITRNINIIPTGLELNHFADVEDKDVQAVKDEYGLNGKFTVLFLGRIAAEKSIDWLLKAAAKARTGVPNLQVMIVGGGPSLDDLKDQAEALGISEITTFTGPKFMTEVPAYYHAADLFVTSSVTETQGLTIIEAMAAGLPVLARYDQNFENVVLDGENGYFYETIDELADKITALSAEDLTPLQDKARRHAHHFSSETFYDKMFSVYQRAINSFIYEYTVESIAKDDRKRQYVTFRCDNHTIRIGCSQAALERYGLMVGETISREELDALKDLEKVDDAYRQALKWLEYKDYSYEMMSKRLSGAGYDTMQTEMTMELLIQHHLIDDREYAHEQVEKALRQGYGIKRAAVNLKREGVAAYVIDETLETLSGDDEIARAKELVEKLYRENTSRSPAALVASIRNKLFRKGFSEDTVSRAMAEVPMDFPKDHTRQLLEKEYARVYKRYSAKFEDRRLLKNKIITFLVQKGYTYEDVTALMADVWEG